MSNISVDVFLFSPARTHFLGGAHGQGRNGVLFAEPEVLSFSTGEKRTAL
jgi:hypothetical protein